MTGVTDLPVELLLDNLLPTLDVPDLLSLSATNKAFASLASDETFWKRKLEQDFNFFGNRTARDSGWKVIYKGLSNPELYRWGATDHGRLGDPRAPQWTRRGLPYPMPLQIPGVRIVDIVAGGWSFHALDSQGRVHVWGTLNGEAMSLNSDGFAVSEKVAQQPLRLDLPAPVRSVSCARGYSMAIDSNDHIWTFLSWGRPYKLTSPLLDGSTPDATPIQIECGWTFSSALTASGDVLVWFPFDDVSQQQIRGRLEEMRQEGDKEARATSDGAIPCVTWDFAQELYRLPPIPSGLPEIRSDGQKGEVKLVKIAGMDLSIIGLTNKGHVLRFDNAGDAASVGLGGWIYLPYFSETQKLREHPAYRQSVDSGAENSLKSPEDLHITHISAHFRTFVAYSIGAQSALLMGDSDNTIFPDARATVIPSLQNINVISVVLGDYHYGALTADGRLLTWGAYSRGALGLGDPTNIESGQPGGFRNAQQRDMAQRGPPGRVLPSDVTVPTEVRWDHATKQKGRKKSCFAAAAAGWHMGALVIDLEGPTTEEQEIVADEEDLPMPGQFEPGQSHIPRHNPGELPGFPLQPLEPTLRSRSHIHAVHPFRIGFAGRGRGLGRGQNPDQA